MGDLDDSDQHPQNGSDKSGPDGEVRRDEPEERVEAEAEPAGEKRRRTHNASSKTEDLDALLDSLNGSAERFQTLWFSFLGLTLYLAIAALTTTHRNLLLGEQQTLPILNIKVPLLPFYVIAPLLYLVFHFYVLMMLVLLARTAATFEQELLTMLPSDVKQEKYRARVENALFLQILIGMKQERAGFNGAVLSLIARITILWAPLATLILIQLQFLPYHSLGITWWHRALVLADMVLIIVIWRNYSVQNSIEWPFLQFVRDQRLRDGLVWVGYLSLLVVVFWLSFLEGRWAGEPWIGRRDFASTANGVVFGLFPDRLKLNDETIVGEKTLKETMEEIASRRDDFVPTIKLDYRDLQAANLSGTDLRRVFLNRAAMQGANLQAGRLDGARLVDARLQGVVLSYANLQGADLTGAKLQGAYLDGAKLQDADLSYAQLQGAILDSAELEGANLSQAQLQAASLGFADLRGASLAGAQLPGAFLLEAWLQGADLQKANLRGVNFVRARLQGADLSAADLYDSRFNATLVFRTNTANTLLLSVSIASVRANQIKLDDAGAVQPLAQADIDAWIATATQFAAEKDKVEIKNRFNRLKLDFQTAEQDAADEAKWSELTKQSLAADPDSSRSRERLTTLLGDLACGSDGEPYVARGLISNGGTDGAIRLCSRRQQLTAIRDRMEEGHKTPNKCPGVAGFTDRDWLALAEATQFYCGDQK